MKKLFPLLFLMIISCSKEEVIVDEFADCKPTVIEFEAYVADPETGLIEFDIIPPKNGKASVTSNADLLWDKGIVPYVIKGSEPCTINGVSGTCVGFNREEDKAKIRNALAELSKDTGILFPEYETVEALKKEHKDGVQIISGFASSSSYLGKKGGMQVLKLAFGLKSAVIKHEFLHALGLNHEFTRKDRDEYVDIFFENIPERMHRQFDIKEEATDCGEFDFNSVMMYGSFEISKDSTKTEMTKKDGSTFERGADLSEGDISSVKALYEDKFKERNQH